MYAEAAYYRLFTIMLLFMALAPQLASAEEDTEAERSSRAEDTAKLDVIEDQVEVHLSSGKTIRGRIVGMEGGRMRLKLGQDDLAIVPMSLVLSYNAVAASASDEVLQDKVEELKKADEQRSRDLAVDVLYPNDSGASEDSSSADGGLGDPAPPESPRLPLAPHGSEPFVSLDPGASD
ncbi:MAG: hypothetical protein AAGI01_17435 [Myxococcota bacterium]